MKAYRYVLKYSYPELISRDGVRELRSFQTHATPEQARQEAMDFLTPGARKGLTYEIDTEEVELDDKVIIEGIVREDGEYEDYHINISNEIDIQGIIAKYMGQKVRVTIEII